MKNYVDFEELEKDVSILSTWNRSHVTEKSSEVDDRAKSSSHASQNITYLPLTKAEVFEVLRSLSGRH